MAVGFSTTGMDGSDGALSFRLRAPLNASGLLVAVSGATAPSLLNVRLSSVDPKIMYGAISNVPREAADDVTNGAVVTLDEGGARLHRLPTR
jgi:hypothetical protein